MRYSLLHRFHGALLGAALGEVLGANCQRQLQAGRSIDWRQMEAWGFLPINPLQAAPGLGKSAIEQAHRLLGNHAGQSLRAQASLESERSAAAEQLLSSAAELSIAALPAMLLSHENPQQIQPQIQKIAKLGQYAAGAEIGAAILGNTISLALREQLQPERLPHQLITGLDLDRLAPEWVQPLTQLQQAAAKLTATPVQSPVLLALEAFLATPEDFRLTLLRVAQQQIDLPMSCAIAGALSGAHNSLSGLPLTWRRRLATAPESLQTLWSVASEAELLQWATALLAHWSGAYHPLDWLQRSPLRAVIAAPRVIRPR